MNLNKDWYDQIEQPVRSLVKLLRNQGFNTTCSCGHDKTIQLEWYGFEGEIHKLCSLLLENEYEKFELHGYWSSDGVSKFLEIRLLND